MSAKVHLQINTSVHNDKNMRRTITIVNIIFHTPQGLYKCLLKKILLPHQ